MEIITAVGRRKAAVARIFLKKGKGNITINNKSVEDFLSIDHLSCKVRDPLKILELEDQFDIKVNVKGGGVKGQAEAIRLGITRALVKVNEEYKASFKAKDLMTRDSRVVERKKPGLRKARKRDQFSKR